MEKMRRRVLEIGSGPVPISMISASRWCEWIVCSDFLEQNRQRIKQWLMTASAQPPPTPPTPGQKHDETWLPFFRYVAQLERAEYYFPFFASFFSFLFISSRHICWNFSPFLKHLIIIIKIKIIMKFPKLFLFPLTFLNSSRSETTLLDRVRRSVRAVVPCNVLLTDPLMDYKDAACTAADGHSIYDVIISTLCLEFASLSPEEYSAAVGNVARLLRPSGYFIIQVKHFHPTPTLSWIINQPTNFHFSVVLVSLSLLRQNINKGALGNSHYWHNNHQFPSVPLSRVMVESALAGAGCAPVDWKEMARCCPPQDKPADHSAVFYCLARKM